MPRKRRGSEIRDGEIAIRDRKPSVSTASLFRLDGFSRSRTRGLGSWGEGQQAIAEAESRTHVHIWNHGRDRRRPSRLECSDGRWASVVGPKPPKGNYRWGPKILGARCGRATCAGPKPGLNGFSRFATLTMEFTCASSAQQAKQRKHRLCSDIHSASRTSRIVELKPQANCQLAPIIKHRYMFAGNF